MIKARHGCWWAPLVASACSLGCNAILGIQDHELADSSGGNGTTQATTKATSATVTTSPWRSSAGGAGGQVATSPISAVGGSGGYVQEGQSAADAAPPTDAGEVDAMSGEGGDAAFRMLPWCQPAPMNARNTQWCAPMAVLQPASWTTPAARSGERRRAAVSTRPAWRAHKALAPPAHARQRFVRKTAPSARLADPRYLRHRLQWLPLCGTGHGLHLTQRVLGICAQRRMLADLHE